MTKKLSLLALIILLGLFNYSIFQQEEVRLSDDIAYIKLAPVDPRSIMQGDYMILNYDVAVTDDINDKTPRQGSAIVTFDENKLIHSAAIYNGQELKENQRLMPYKLSIKDAFWLQPRSYFFQEGKGYLYANAKYAIFKFEGKSSLLFGLTDENKKQL